ncbi:MAG: EutP/PduV family microcompartment system protein [Brasilonema angustatum HA4187-MV1]|jgi:polynucleotide 5'-kinase involved in rRNA processing|nr:EutP/PduV family microcompartment system protein [Brasilonema angustatum HA4187-MV1]
MAKAADIGGKRLISLAPDAWVKWVTHKHTNRGKTMQRISVVGTSGSGKTTLAQ